MTEKSSACGLWFLVFINSAIFIVFAFNFFKPKTERDWKSLGAFSAFLVALFTEMYGFPLTIYLQSGWSQTNYPSVDWFAHDSGDKLEMLFGWKTNPHSGSFHILSFALIGAGFVIISAGRRIHYHAQANDKLAVTGVYPYVRHPQHAGFVLVMLGFLVQWPTILTFAMLPVLVWMYVSLARSEEREAYAQFGDEYVQYAKHVPAFFPKVPIGPGQGDQPWRMG